MTKFDEIANRPDHSNNWFCPDGPDSLALDGSFTKDQLLELLKALETFDRNPVPYTVEMAAEDDELLADLGSESSLSDFGPNDMPLG